MRAFGSIVHQGPLAPVSAGRVARPVAARPVESLRRALGNAGAGRLAQAALAAVREVTSAPGAALEPGVRATMESAFDRDFSGVRLHTGPGAERSAQALGARAYAVDSHIVFGAGQHQTATREGRRLLAHELAHVAQSGRDGGGVVRRQPASSSGPTLEEAVREADWLQQNAPALSTEELQRSTAVVEWAMSSYAGLKSEPLSYGAALSDAAAAGRKELEAREAVAVAAKVKDNVASFVSGWKTKLKEELLSQGVTEIEDWALEAAGHFVGIPYASAHQFYGGADDWRKAYYDFGIYPASIVCDQLGELTQRLARGMTAYGPQGLTGHYTYYMKNDGSFPTPPDKTSDARAAAGATLFVVKPETWDFEAEAALTSLHLFNNGVPKVSDWSSARVVPARAAQVKAIKAERKKKGTGPLLKAIANAAAKYSGKPWSTKLEELAAAIGKEPGKAGDLVDVFAAETFQTGADDLSAVFESDKRITHEYTLVAQIRGGKGPADRLLFLDTWGPGGKGTMQLRPSTLAKEKDAHWGFVTPLKTRRIPMVSPYRGVVLKISGRNLGERTFADVWTTPPIPPPVVFRFALEDIAVQAVKVELEFTGEIQQSKVVSAQPMRILTLSSGAKPRWVKPPWMPRD